MEQLRALIATEQLAASVDEELGQRHRIEAENSAAVDKMVSDSRKETAKAADDFAKESIENATEELAASKRLWEAADAEEKKRQDLISALTIEADAKQRVTDATMLGRDALDAMNLELEIEANLRKLGNDASPAEIQAVVDKTAATSAATIALRNYNEELEKQKQAEEKAQREAEKAAKAIQRQLEDQAKAVQKFAQDAGTQIVDAFINMAEGAKKPFDGLLNYAKRIFEQMVAAALLNPIIVPVVASMVGGIGGLGGSTGAGGALSAASGLVSLGGSAGIFGAGGLGAANLIDTLGYNYLGIGGTVSSSGIMGGASPFLSSYLGYGAIGALGGGLLADVLGLNKTGGSIGGGIGSAIGTIGGPIGTVVGGLLGSLLGGLFGSALLAWALGWIKTYILALVSERIGADLRTTTYEHLLKLSLEYFGGRRTGDLMARIGNETDRINVFLSLHLLDFATDVLMILMTAGILFSINPTLALATLLPLPFIGWLIHAVRDRLRTGFEKIDRVWSEVTSVLADTIPGIRVVKAFAQEDREAQRFRDANRYNLEVNDRLNRLWSLFSPTVSLLTEIGLLMVWGFGIWLVSKDSISVGVLTAFIAYIGRFYTRLDSMSRIVSVTQKAASGAKRIFDILDHVSSVPEPAQPVVLPKLRGKIEIRGAGFRYGNRAVIRDLDLTLNEGEMIGLVGHSGSGKSTLVNLICRFYDLSEGAILVDGTDIRQMGIADYRRHIGLVLQEPFLFFGTIAENIAYGKPDATREEIVAAARAAHAHDFILRLPLGYDSLVGERGQGLSGGERQRISIARALLIDPRILILDEATSAVDTETEKEIQKALDNLVQGRTTIAIAHRLSTLRKADRLVVMDKGLKVEEGSHDELIAREGAYFRLYQAQQRQAEANRDMLPEE